jgi:hypothetical protein
MISLALRFLCVSACVPHQLELVCVFVTMPCLVPPAACFETAQELGWGGDVDASPGASRSFFVILLFHTFVCV